MLNYPIHLKTSENRFFHGKFYLFEGDSKAFVMIGSSNISGSGFCANYEVNLLYILDVNSELFKSFKEEFKVIWECGTSIEELNLKKFSGMDIDFEYDQLSNPPKPYDELDYGWFNSDNNTPVVEKVDDDTENNPGSGRGIRLDDLPNEEIKRRFQYWHSKRPTSILKDLNLPEFDGYILFEYKDHELLVLESFDPDKALYCFKNQGTFEELKNKILTLTKKEIQQKEEELCLTRKYHKIDKVTIDDEIETLFVKKSDYTLI